MRASLFRSRDKYAMVSFAMVEYLGGDIIAAAVFDWVAWKADAEYGGVITLDGKVWFAQSRSALAEAMGISEKTARSALDRLVAAGHLETRQLHLGGPFDTTNSYTPVWSESAPTLAPEGQSIGPEVPLTLAPEGQSSFSQDVSNTGQVKGHPSTEEVDVLFAQFWSKYPRRVKRADARKRFAIALRRAPFDVIMDGLDRYVRSVSGKEPEYIQHPTAWLNQQRWDDEDATTAPALDPYANRRRFGQAVAQ